MPTLEIAGCIVKALRERAYIMWKPSVLYWLFALILGVTGRFHFAYGFTYTLAAYLAFNFHARGTWAGPFHNGVPFIVAAILGILCAALVGTGIERFVYRPIATRAGATALLAIFVAALGIGIAGQSLIGLVWSQQSMPFYDKGRHVAKVGWHVWKVVRGPCCLLRAMQPIWGH